MRANKINDMGKLPPQAIETEEAVLGALLLENDAYDAIGSIININSFYKPEHQTIFKTIKELHECGKPVDLLIVTQELKNRGLLDQVGGPYYITQLTSKVSSSAHIEYHARILAEKYISREIIKDCSIVQGKAYNGEDIETLQVDIAQINEKIDNVFSVADTGKTLKEAFKDAIQEIEEDSVKHKSKQKPGITTGLKSLDYNTGGWRNGDLIILAARPGVGKTSVALHFLKSAAKAGFWGNFFTLEMKSTDLAKNLLAGESGVWRTDIRDGSIDEQDWQKLNRAIGENEDLPIIFKDAAGMNVNQIRNIIHQNRKRGMCDFVIIDYMQLVKSSQPKAIRELEVSEISRTLKATALNENIPVIALSQLNRIADSERPKLSHLRESGAIEQDADIVCFLVRNEDKILFDVAKHRNGSLADFNIIPMQHMTRFREDYAENNQNSNKVDTNPNEHIEPGYDNDNPF